ncbi:MAG: MFS transporter [Anaerolineales bacterium]|nr:MFS transporter [Anaerolineales bacterium]
MRRYFPLSDNSILGLLRSEPRHYGRIRLWGSIGRGITAPLIGAVVEHRGLTLGF